MNHLPDAISMLIQIQLDSQPENTKTATEIIDRNLYPGFGSSPKCNGLTTGPIQTSGKSFMQILVIRIFPIGPRHTSGNNFTHRSLRFK